ncbi:MAG: alpha/beta hydrolase [Candidatus Hydrogenedentota bacterium]
MTVKIFILALRLPLLRHWISSHSGITFSMRFGVQNKKNLTADVMKPYLEPFISKEARTALLLGGQGLSVRGFHEIAERLQEIQHPVRLIYGVNDRILPDVAETMLRVKSDIPQAEINALPDCGHFLQEDDPQAIAILLTVFFNER